MAFHMKNLLPKDFTAQQPQTKWVNDITKIALKEVKLCRCVLIDLYDDDVVDWSMDHHQDRQRVIAAVGMSAW